MEAHEGTNFHLKDYPSSASSTHSCQWKHESLEEAYHGRKFINLRPSKPGWSPCKFFLSKYLFQLFLWRKCSLRWWSWLSSSYGFTIKMPLNWRCCLAWKEKLWHIFVQVCTQNFLMLRNTHIFLYSGGKKLKEKRKRGAYIFTYHILPDFKQQRQVLNERTLIRK